MMDTPTAQLIVVAGAIVAVLTWMLAMRAVRGMAVGPEESDREVLLKRAKLAPARNALLKSLLEVQPNKMQQSPEILERRDNRILFQIGSFKTEMTLEDRYEGVHIRALTDASDVGRRRSLIVGTIVGLMIPLVIAIVAGILWKYVAASPNKAVRWQVFQIVQLLHILWPPFLVTTLFRKQREAAYTMIGNVLLATELRLDEPHPG